MRDKTGNLYGKKMNENNKEKERGREKRDCGMGDHSWCSSH